MRLFIKNILFLGFLTISFIGHAQFDPTSISRIENGKIQFTLDLRWSDSLKNEVEELFNLDSTLWEKIEANTTNILLDSIEWEVEYLSKFILLLSKNLENLPAYHFNENDVFLIDENWKDLPGYVDQEKIIFGVNSFKKSKVFQYDEGRAMFYLPGYQKSTNVYIAGSFNSWNPLQTLMTKADSGWITNISLPPGKHLYKYIVDGNWMADPNNSLIEDDGQGNRNSAVYCPNYVFKLKGYTKARRVYVSGTFNQWNRRELRMQVNTEGWYLPVYLKDGTYSYKFIVDEQWITDPASSFTRTDASGNLNSVIGFGEEYVFRLKGFTDAGRVQVAGNFNNWDSNELVMENTQEGWQLPLRLAPGNYEYKFIVDGRWIPDPSNPFAIGSGDYVNSFFAFKANHLFTIDAFPDAKEVKLTGTFNNWSHDGYRMVKKDGKWTFPVYLSKGKHLYKLIVDGEWLIDPTNKLWDDNEYGTGNSVLWIN